MCFFVAESRRTVGLFSEKGRGFAYHLFFLFSFLAGLFSRSGCGGVVFNFVRLEFFGGGFAAFRPAQDFPLGFFSRKGLFGSLAYEVALYFGAQPEGEGQHLALYVVAETVVVLDGPYLAILFHAKAQDFHDHEQASPQTGKFGTDYDVVFANPVEQVAKFPFVVVFSSRNRFFNPTVDAKTFIFAESAYFETLVFNGLAVAAHPNVSVNHSV